MTRYLLFLVLGLILGFFVLIGAPKSSVLADLFGLLILSFGTSKFLTSHRTGGFLALIGLAMILHVLVALWFNFIILNQERFITQAIILYGGLTLTMMILSATALYSALSDRADLTKLDRTPRSAAWTRILQALPPLLMLAEFGLCYFYWGL